MLFYGEDCKKFLVIFKGLYSSVDLLGICGMYYIAVKMLIRLTVIVNKQYNYIQDDNQSNKTGGISTGKKKYIAGG